MIPPCKDILYLCYSYLNIEEILSIDNYEVVNTVFLRYSIYVPYLDSACANGLYLSVKYYIETIGRHGHFHTTLANHFKSCKGASDLISIIDTTPESLCIYFACLGGNLKIIRYLIENTIMPIKPNNYAIWLASIHGNIDIVKYLYEYGLRPDSGMIRLIRKRGYIEIAGYLRSKQSLFTRFTEWVME